MNLSIVESIRVSCELRLRELYQSVGDREKQNSIRRMYYKGGMSNKQLKYQ